MKKENASITLPSRIRHNGDQFRLLVESVQDYGIFMLNPEGRIVSWNAGAERIKGYKPGEIIGTHFSAFYPQEDIQSGKPTWELKMAAAEGRFEDEGWRIRKDGSRFWANVIITALRDASGELVGYGKVTRDFTDRKHQEERLAQAEQRLRLLIEGVADYALYMLDSDGKVTTWNSGAEKIKGFHSSETIGRHFSMFFTEEDKEAGEPQRIIETASTQGRSEHEGWRVRKDGSRFWVNAVVTAIRDQSGKLVGFSKITRDVTEKMQQQKALLQMMAERQKAQEELAKSEESLRQLSLNLLRIQDEERRRIGREMHDSLGQYLSALKMKLGILKASQPELSSQAKKELTEAAGLLDHCVTEVRTISYLLYPPMLEESGLKSAIGWYLDGFSQRSGIEAKFQMSSEIDRLSRDAELALFRLLQEALTNVHKHSGSSFVDISIMKKSEDIVLEIRDYGRGLPESVQKQAGNWSSSLGIGLRGMSERMRQLGGSFTVEAANPGTLVQATLPERESRETLDSQC